MKKTYTDEHRAQFLADVITTAGVFACSLFVLGLILIRSGLLPIIS